MVAVNVAPFEIEVTTRHGDLVRADVYWELDLIDIKYWVGIDVRRSGGAGSLRRSEDGSTGIFSVPSKGGRH